MTHDTWFALALWPARVLAGGGLLLLLVWGAVKLVRQPARRQRIAEWGVAASLLLAVLCLAPAWLRIPLLPASPTVEHPPEKARSDDALAPEPLAVVPLDEQAVAVEPPPPVIEKVPGPAEEKPAQQEQLTETTPTFPPVDFLAVLPALAVCGYLAGMTYFLGRLVWGYRRLRRFLVTALPAPEKMSRVLDELTPEGGRPRLLLSSHVRVPISCGLLNPTIVLPATLIREDDEIGLRWVLAHELTHLQRRDALTSLLFGLARAVYFPLPWFWALRRQVTLCQEYVADATAATEADSVADYAEFLLRWCNAPAVPAGATGVSGHSSDLFRRITMLVREPIKVEARCPRRWSLLAATALLSLGVIAAGVGLTRATADETKKDITKEPAKKVDPRDDKKEEKKPEKKNDPLLPGIPDVEDLMKQLGGLDEETAQRIRKQLEMSRKMMEQMRKQFPGGGLLPGDAFPGGLFPFPELPQLQPFAPLPNRLPGAGLSEPRMGAMLAKPSTTLVDQLDLPREQGLIVERVKEDSPAAKAGLKPHDILLELDGKPVPSDVSAFNKQLADVKPGKEVEAVVLRKSKKETLKGLTLPEAKVQPLQPRNPFRFQFPNPLGGVGGLGGVTTLKRTNDSFTAKNVENGVTVSVTGTIDQGKAKVGEITIDAGGKTQSYDSVEKVPAEHRDKVEGLIRSAEGGRPRKTIRL